MINKGQINAEELKIQGLLDRFLKFRTASTNFRGSESHLDDDSLTAFIEGKINEREASGIITHLINCSFCLHVTGELAKLSDSFAEDEVMISAVTKEPTKVSEVLSGLLSRIFGTNDGAVFAHQEDEKESEDKEDKDKV
ncbi:MAG: hypothetical protein HC846_06275 [Blastocatellia bacterium]|nr:hypothetical protein [Blastocatellia bacterium]